MPLDLTTFTIKWEQTELNEKSAYQQHFRDLCEALGVPHPTEEDVVGTSYMFEKHVTKVGGGSGFADVWKRDTFAWEYKLPGGDLNKAYKQLNEYHEDLGNPPLLIVCDFKRAGGPPSFLLCAGGCPTSRRDVGLDASCIWIKACAYAASPSHCPW